MPAFAATTSAHFLDSSFTFHAATAAFTRMATPCWPGHLLPTAPHIATPDTMPGAWAAIFRFVYTVKLGLGKRQKSPGERF